MAPGDGSTGLARRLITVAPGSRFEGTAGSGGELWYVISGCGRLDAGNYSAAPVREQSGAWLPPGTRYLLRADPDADLRLDAVALPAPEPGTAADPARLAELRDCEVERTGDRRFRVLFGPGRGCEAATQFVGEIPPGRAPEHTHAYDELVLVLAGQGVAHVADGDRPLAPGARLHLPPGLAHCLENTGADELVVLGVFHPGGSPAAKKERS
jgi:quercetin dioxygenase-like cupin family protein